MFGLGIQEVILLAMLALGAGVVIAVVVLRGNSSGRERPRGD